jgi:hypothetical protein
MLGRFHNASVLVKSVVSRSDSMWWSKQRFSFLTLFRARMELRMASGVPSQVDMEMRAILRASVV